MGKFSYQLRDSPVIVDDCLESIFMKRSLAKIKCDHLYETMWWLNTDSGPVKISECQTFDCVIENKASYY